MSKGEARSASSSAVVAASWMIPSSVRRSAAEPLERPRSLPPCTSCDCNAQAPAARRRPLFDVPALGN
jgi:hypothetical protein